jgi:hypothetical protein
MRHIQVRRPIVKVNNFAKVNPITVHDEIASVSIVLLVSFDITVPMSVASVVCSALLVSFGITVPMSIAIAVCSALLVSFGITVPMSIAIAVCSALPIGTALAIRIHLPASLAYISMRLASFVHVALPF